MGGAGCSVNEATESILLECARFNPGAVRRTARAHGLNTDASFHFERGIDPEMAHHAILRTLALLKETCPDATLNYLDDKYLNPAHKVKLNVSLAEINKTSGLQLKKEEVEEILHKLGFELSGKGEYWEVHVPTDKVDVTRNIDVVEEVLRIYGLNKIPIPDKWEIPDKKLKLKNTFILRSRLSAVLKNFGAYESYFLSFGPARQLERWSDDNLQIINPLSEAISTMYPSLLPAGLNAVAYNLNRQQDDFSLFSFGKSYKKVKENTSEEACLGIWSVGTGRGAGNWHEKFTGFSTYSARGLLNQLLHSSSADVSSIEIKLDQKSVSYSHKSVEGDLAKVIVVDNALLQTFGIHDRQVIYLSLIHI